MVSQNPNVKIFEVKLSEEQWKRLIKESACGVEMEYTKKGGVFMILSLIIDSH